jgi:NADP-dependent 3-hydroxy acid dehydrogenase YdfG
MISDRTALVTGATSGIGREIAISLLRSGAHVAAIGRRGDRLEELSEFVDGPGGLLALAGDVRDPNFVGSLPARLGAWRPSLDILVNAAGLSRSSPFNASGQEDIRLVVETNLLSVVLLSRTMIPMMRSGGDIVNFGSTAAANPGAGVAVYSATKAGVAAFSQSLRRELLGQGIRVSLIHPGYVRTEFLDYVNDPDRRARLDQTLDEIDAMEPKDVANVVLFMIGLPPKVCISELHLRPAKQVP